MKYQKMGKATLNTSGQNVIWEEMSQFMGKIGFKIHECNPRIKCLTGLITGEMKCYTLLQLATKKYSKFKKFKRGSKIRPP
jgi:hypothetical protein